MNVMHMLKKPVNTTYLTDLIEDMVELVLKGSVSEYIFIEIGEAEKDEWMRDIWKCHDFMLDGDMGMSDYEHCQCVSCKAERRKKTKELERLFNDSRKRRYKR